MLKQHAFTVDDLMTMSDAGVFGDGRVELLDGVIYDMSPPNPDHADIVDELTQKFIRVFGGRARLRGQNPLDIGDPLWLPHPDVLLVKPGRYFGRHPTPEDVLLLVEVSSTTQKMDRGRKLEAYASVGIRDYWIADLTLREWTLHRDPLETRYCSVTRVLFSTPVAPLEFPEDAHPWL